MKNLIFSFLLVSISFISNCQNTYEVQAMLAEYKSSDTIMLDDFLKLTELSLSKKDYSIISFNFNYINSNGFTISMDSNSNKITGEMKNSLAGLNKKDYEMFRIVFENIKVKTPQNDEISIGALVYKFQLK